MVDEATRWALHDGLRWRTWSAETEEEYLIFNTGSGETHCVNFTAAFVLQLLEERPMTIEAVASRICQVSPQAADAVLKHIHLLFGEFDRVGLIVPALS